MASKLRQFNNVSQGTCIASTATVADSFLSRFVGLLASPPLQPGQGLLIVPCNSIHMFGMKFPIDVIFFDKSWTVVGLIEGIKPGGMSKIFGNAHCCLELPCGAIASSRTSIGDQVKMADAEA